MHMNLQELFHIDKNIPVPLYYQFKQELKNRIQDGTFKVNDQIPTENEFCETHWTNFDIKIMRR